MDENRVSGFQALPWHEIRVCELLSIANRICGGTNVGREEDS
jgi:hypothetical protein